jgi:copper resistance protein B
MTASTRARIALVITMITHAAFAQDHHDHTQHPQHEPAETSQASTHVPPDPPSHVLEPMSTEQMHEMMEMDDSARFGGVAFDRAEWREQDDTMAWSAAAWYGGDYNKLMIKSEGELHSDDDELRSEVLWDRAISSWWNLQTGVRMDSGTAPTRTWLAFGLEGLAPYWIDVDTTFYVADEGRTALRVELRHDVRLTQRLILQPQIEANAYGKSDARRSLGSGLSDVEAGLRLRYEFRREIAPYIGVHWTSLFGETSDYARAVDEDDDVVQFVAGIRFWF